MRALVVFESMFGNTQTIAQAVADGLSQTVDVDVVEVDDAPTRFEGFDLLVVGGPTHAFGLSREGTRRSAAEQATDGVVSTGAGLREWLGAVSGGSAGIVAAAFDTRVRKPGLPGSAARGVEKRLRRLGYRMLEPATSFYVGGTPGPLLDGESQRARRWGQELGAKLAQVAQDRPEP